MANKDMQEVFNTTKTRPIYEETPLIKPIGVNEDVIIEERMDIREVLSLKMFKMLQEIDNKLTKGRIKDKETEKIRIDYIKTYINGCNCFMNLTKQRGVNTYYDKEILKEFINLEDAPNDSDGNG